MGAEGKPHKHNRRYKALKKITNKESRGQAMGSPARRFSTNENVSKPQKIFRRKQADPETIKYFSEISNVLENPELELEERTIICGNALEESRGKEIDLSTDYIISHTMQSLVEGCDLDHLRSYLENCGHNFLPIVNDRSGSHVVESAIKSLTWHLQNDESHSGIEAILRTLCEAIATNPIDVMCNCYGSHVLRRLLYLFIGEQMESGYDSKTSSVILAERLNIKDPRMNKNEAVHPHKFPQLLKFLVEEMLNHASKDIKVVILNQYGSLVLQTALKALVGDDQELLYIIPIILSCNEENTGPFIRDTAKREIMEFVNDTSFSHLMEVVLEVAPETLYDEILRQVFLGSLVKLSSKNSASFVLQALISNTRNKDQVTLIWDEIGTKFMDILCGGKTGVVGSLIASCQRLQTLENKCCQALVAAVCPENVSTKLIVPRILFLDNYFSCEDQSSWSWTSGSKLHLLGSLILQIIFRFQSEFIHPFSLSITSIGVDHLLEMLKDVAGARVLEAFLISYVSKKLKLKLISRLRGHFGDISLYPSGSFILEKCFSVSSTSLREGMVSELLHVRDELSKRKHGPFLLNLLDVNGYARKPDQWRSMMESKECVYNRFSATFGSSEANLPSKRGWHHPATSTHNKMKHMRMEITSTLPTASSSFWS